ncbi:cystine/glutamate transporter-like [Diadema setosum]|uniref:cystine/glutamate transporter-like n=1 Tax=Diadema setosum TaxID=31175 RepID=UPI003B3A8047
MVLKEDPKKLEGQDGFRRGRADVENDRWRSVKDDVHVVDDDEPCESNSDADGGDKVAIPRHLGLFGCVWHLIGTIIGTGIFISPTGVLRGAGGSVGVSFLLWIACAVINVCGALTLAELSVVMKKSGGDFTFILQSWGPLVAFVRLWVQVFLISPGATILQALVISKYILTPFFQNCLTGAPASSIRLLSACWVLFFMAVNCFSVRLTSRLAGFFGVMKTFGLVVLIVTGFYNLAQGHTEHFQHAFDNRDYDVRLLPTGLLSGIWAYSGWSIITTVTEEIKSPGRNIPLSIITAMSLITGVYLLANVAYLTLLSPEEILTSDAVAADYSVLALGHWSWLIWVFVAMSAMGNLNSGMFKQARVTFAAAREGHFPEIFSMVSIRRLTPLPALLYCLLSLFCLIELDVINLVEYVGFADAVTETLTVAIVPYYRWKYPDMPRPFKVPLVIAILYFCTLCFISAMSFYADPLRKGLGILAALVAIPVYYALVHPKYRLKCLQPISRKVTRFLQKVLLCVHQEKKTF